MVGHVLLGALTQESQESELDWVRVVHKLVKRNKQTNKQTNKQEQRTMYFTVLGHFMGIAGEINS